jgi:hypothetical protein
MRDIKRYGEMLDALGSKLSSANFFSLTYTTNRHFLLQNRVAVVLVADWIGDFVLWDSWRDSLAQGIR